MTLPASFPLSMSQVATELGTTLPLSLLDPDVVALAGLSGPPVSMSDLLGKSAGGQQEWTAPGLYSFVVPAGTWTVTFKGIGGGASGGTGKSGSNAGGGGSSSVGKEVVITNVPGGRTYEISVGPGGLSVPETSTPTRGNDGEHTVVFDEDNDVLVLQCLGGIGGSSNDLNINRDPDASGEGSVIYAGRPGLASTSSSSGGKGGGGCNSSFQQQADANGGNASTGTGSPGNGYGGGGGGTSFPPGSGSGAGSGGYAIAIWSM